jgi:Family of unknown function (DUF6529)
MTQARAVPRPAGRLAVAGGLALAVAVALYALGRVHTPDYAMGLLGQHGGAVNRLKAQLATVMLALALSQLTLALWMYGKLPRAGPAPPPVPTLHRLGGATLFLVQGPGVLSICPAGGVEPGGMGQVWSTHELPGSCGSHSLMTRARCRTARPGRAAPVRVASRTG